MRSLLPCITFLGAFLTASAQTDASRAKPIDMNIAIRPPGGQAVDPLGPGPIEYPKEVAPVIEQCRAGWPEVKARFLAGLPRKDTLNLFIRFTAEQLELAKIKVDSIDPKSGAISGSLAESIPGSQIFVKKTRISAPDSAIVDWQIVHADGSVEGNAFARYVASLGDKVSAATLITDQREIDLKALRESPQLQKAIDDTALAFFNVPGLKVESVNHDHLQNDWPSLREVYRGKSPSQTTADLKEKVTAAAGRLRVEISELPAEGVTTVIFYIVMKRSGRIFEIRQYLHFAFGGHVLHDVGWGIRSIRIIKPKGT